MEIFIDHQNNNYLLPKFRVSIKMFKDRKEAFSLLADTRDSPYKFEVSAPKILPNLIGVPAVDADITHTVEDRSYEFAPTSKIQISTNIPQFQTLDIRSSGKFDITVFITTYMKKISDKGIYVIQEGKIVIKVFNFIGGRSSNSLEADVEFGHSKKARLIMSWENQKVSSEKPMC